MNSSAQVTVSHSGKQHAYQHALSCQRLNRLHRFVTSTYYKPGAWPDRVLSLVPRADRFLSRRRLPELDADSVVRRPMLELPEIWYRNVLHDGRRAEQAMFRRDARFDAWVAARYASDSPVFWGFQGSCLESLRAARNGGRTAVCEFATAHVTAAIRILSEESLKHPEWAGTISNFAFPDWYRDRLQQEPLAADYCVAASDFTRRSLVEVGVLPERIRLLPLAADTSEFQACARSGTGPLRVLFVGGIGQRKGIKYLLQAMERIHSDQIELSLLGPLPADPKPLEEWKRWFRYLGRTDQAGVVRHMQQADVLVLPSVFEGFGLVIVEALATGLPVIASTHSCGPEVIREGVDGFVLQPDDVDGLASRLDWCASHRSELVELGQNAAERARLFSWQSHSERLEVLLDSLVPGTNSALQQDHSG